MIKIVYPIHASFICLLTQGLTSPLAASNVAHGLLSSCFLLVHELKFNKIAVIISILNIVFYIDLLLKTVSERKKDHNMILQLSNNK
jgi:hypothetical protein